MKVELTITATKADDGKLFLKQNGKEVTIDSLIKTRYRLKDSIIYIRLLENVDDTPDKIEKEDMANNRLKTISGEDVVIYTTDATDEFPYLGVINRERPCLWKKDGTPSSDNENDRLKKVQKEIMFACTGLTSKSWKPIYVNKANEPIENLTDEIIKTFDISENRQVSITMTANDYNHETVKVFDASYINKYLNKKINMKMKFTTGDYLPVTIYTTAAAEEFNILGKTDDGRILQWNKNGESKDGNPENRLLIHLDKKNN